MTRNKDYRKQLEGQRRAILRSFARRIAEHLEKIANEQKKLLNEQDQGLIAHWEKTVANCRQQIYKLERRLNP